MHKLFVSKKIWITVGLFIYISLFFLKQTNLTASDLGRHVKNGEIIWHTGQVFHTNLYSYTNPDFFAPNHHWLFGVISYLTHRAAGFEGLTVVGALLYVGAIAVVFLKVQKKTGVYATLAATLLVLPLLTDRAETRPEAFSLFFFSLLFVGFSFISEQKTLKYFWHVVISSTAIMALWVNIHIFFVLAAVLGIAFAIHTYIKKQTHYFKWLGGIAGGLILGTFINPLGIQLVLYPLQIFGNYGYRVSENQPLWFFLQHFTRPIHWYIACLIIVYIALVAWVIKKHHKVSPYYLITSIFFMLFTIKLIRMQNIFALSAIPLLSLALQDLWQSYGGKLHSTLIIMTSSIVGFGLVSVLIGTGLFFPFSPGLGIGLTPGNDRSLTFVREAGLHGPIFNNFDIGSFLIYTLYPNQKVFMDNRAEAYPAEFIQSEYLKAQKDEEKWQELESKYSFSTIIFYRHEQTDWGQDFLVKRFKDPTWITVYVDNYIIIFAKDTLENQELIKKYRLPDEMFSVN